MIGGFDAGNKVLQISNDVVAKRGHGVTPSEAAAQRYTYQYLKPRVPRVYCYFQVRSDPSWPIGYLFMEYIPGQTLEDLDLSSSSEDIFEYLANAMHTWANRWWDASRVLTGEIMGHGRLLAVLRT